jgi:hypothetical protein
MAVAADRVDVEEVGHAQLADADFDSMRRDVRRQRQGRRRDVEHAPAKRNRDVDHRASDIGSGAERRVADHIKVGESRQPERVADPAAAGALQVENELRMIRQLDSGIERPQP